MDGRTGFVWNKKNAKNIKSYNGKKDGEGHDYLQLKGKRHMKEVYSDVVRCTSTSAISPQYFHEESTLSFGLWWLNR